MPNFKKSICVLAVAIFSIVLSSEIVDKLNDDELIFAHVLFRHGNITIKSTYKNDPYRSGYFWPQGFGQLTNDGKRLQYQLGRYLRRRYGKLIGMEYYSPDRMYVRSCHVNRTLMSAQCNVAGLFQPIGVQSADDTIDCHESIPIHSVPTNEDILLEQSVACDKVDKLHKEFEESHQVKTLFHKHTGLRRYLAKNSGSSADSLGDMHMFYSTLNIENMRGLRLPDWAQHVLQTKNNVLEHFSIVRTKIHSCTNEMKKITAGFLIKEIFERFENKTLGTLKPNRVLWLYSAHDHTIFNTLNALGVYRDQYGIPPFASSVHFELYKSRANDYYYMQLFYRMDDSEYLPPIKIPKCGIKCPINELFNIYKHILPSKHETFDSLCKLYGK